MPRSGRLRTFIREYSSSARSEKLSFIPPFLILIVEGILLIHAFTIDVPDIMVVELTTILLAISIIEIVLVTKEIHDRYQIGNFDRILTIKIDDFLMTREKEKNVKKLVEEFIQTHQNYKKHRSKIYHICCQVMETHKEEEMEKDLDSKLKNFIKRRKTKTVDEILSEFVKKYPKYKKYSQDVYQKICVIKGETTKKS